MFCAPRVHQTSKSNIANLSQQRNFCQHRNRTQPCLRKQFPKRIRSVEPCPVRQLSVNIARQFPFRFSIHSRFKLTIGNIRQMDTFTAIQSFHQFRRTRTEQTIAVVKYIDCVRGLHGAIMNNKYAEQLPRDTALSIKMKLLSGVGRNQ